MHFRARRVIENDEMVPCSEFRAPVADPGVGYNRQPAVLVTRDVMRSRWGVSSVVDHEQVESREGIFRSRGSSNELVRNVV